VSFQRVQSKQSSEHAFGQHLVALVQDFAGGRIGHIGGEHPARGGRSIADLRSDISMYSPVPQSRSG